MSAGDHPFAEPNTSLFFRGLGALAGFRRSVEIEAAARRVGAMSDDDLWTALREADGDPDRADVSACAALLLCRRWRQDHVLPDGWRPEPPRSLR